METFTASRLTSGNKLFRSKITIDEIGVTFNDPALFKSREQTIPFDRIATVKIDCPIVGFSAISIETTGEGKINSQGFTAYKVKRMKNLILKNI